MTFLTIDVGRNMGVGFCFGVVLLMSWLRPEARSVRSASGD